MQDREGATGLWGIILAGGEGRRMQRFIREQLGQEVPKQYCTFVGSRSMLQHTIDRMARLIPLDRLVVVASQQHQALLWNQLEGRTPGTILLQPSNADTGAGIFLPLTYVLARDPAATVVLVPTDHFVYPEEALIETIRHAVFASQCTVNQPILVGVRPDAPEVDYGWIRPGRFLSWTGKYPLCAVDCFVEKPSQAEAHRLQHSGALWNTMITIAKGRRLWQLGWAVLPELMALFNRLQVAIDTREERQVLERIYAAMPTRNFSSHLLQVAPRELAVIEARDMSWSDWGHSDRIKRSLDAIGRHPAWAEDGLVAT